MTSIPASRSARATTLTPRSWPSRPALAIKMRRRGSDTYPSLHECGFAVASEHRLHGVAHLLDRRVRPDRLQQVRHHVLIPRCCVTDRRQGTINPVIVSGPLQFLEPPNLLPLHLGIDFQDWNIDRLVVNKVIHPDHDLPAFFQLPL